MGSHKNIIYIGGKNIKSMIPQIQVFKTALVTYTNGIYILNLRKPNVFYSQRKRRLLNVIHS